MKPAAARESQNRQHWLTVPKTNWAPTYASFRIGWELGDGEIWFDDVVLSHSPIPCN